MLALCLGASAAVSAPAELEKCYQKFGQVEETQSDGKKTSVYKDAAEVATQCNEKIIAQAAASTDEGAIKTFAGIIGRNSNWASAMPVFTLAAKRNPKVACSDADAMYGLGDALARPGTDKIAADALAFLTTCWPNGKDEFGKLLTGGQNGYVKTNLCQFLKSKNAIPARRSALCKKALAQ